jgi:hypothetical protein
LNRLKGELSMGRLTGGGWERGWREQGEREKEGEREREREREGERERESESKREKEEQ